MSAREASAFRSLRATGLALMLVAALLIHRFFFAAPSGPTPELLVLSGERLGIPWTVRVAGEDLDPTLRAKVQEVVDERLEEVDRWLSTQRSDSEIARFNASRSTDPFDVSSATAELVAYAIELCKWSSSAFDVTIAPLAARWGLGRGAPVSNPPSQTEIDAYLDRTGAEIIHVGRGNPARGGFLHKYVAEVEVDLSPLAKAYAADHVAGGLFEAGRSDFLVEIGDDVYAAGHRPDGKPWRVRIEEPSTDMADAADSADAADAADASSASKVHSEIELSDQGFSTVFDLRREQIAGHPEVAVARLIDPRTGRPIDNTMASASVIAPTATQAAAFATTLMVLGPKEGLALAEQWRLGAMTLSRSPSGALDESRNALYPRTDPKTASPAPAEPVHE